MVVLGTQDLVDDVTVVRQENEPLGILVQTPDRKDAFGVPDQINDVVLDVGFGRAGDPGRLVQSNVNLLLLGADQIAVDAYLITCGDPGSQARALTVAGDT